MGFPWGGRDFRMVSKVFLQLRILDLSPNDVNYNPKEGFENLRKLKKYTKPLLIIHANEDGIIPIEEAKIMYEKSGSSRKEIWVVENANHNDIFMHARDNYFKKINDFINKIY